MQSETGQASRPSAEAVIMVCEATLVICEAMVRSRAMGHDQLRETFGELCQLQLAAAREAIEAYTGEPCMTLESLRQRTARAMANAE